MVRASDSETWPEHWNQWDGYFGSDTRSSEEIYYNSSDQNLTIFSETGQYRPFPEDPTIGGLGISVQTNVLAWNIRGEEKLKSLDNSFVVVHRIKNNSAKDLDSVIVSNWVADFVQNRSSSNNRVYIPSEKTILFYDSNFEGVAAIKLLSISSGMNVYPFPAGILQVNNDETTYDLMSNSSDSVEVISNNLEDSDVLISSDHLKLEAGESFEFAYSISISQKKNSFEENKNDVLIKSKYVSDQFQSGFTLDNVDQVELSGPNTKINILLDMSSADSIINLESGTVIAELTTNNTTQSYELFDSDNDLIYEGVIDISKKSKTEINYKVDNVGLPGGGYERNLIEIDSVYFNNSNVNEVTIEPNVYFRNIESSGFPVPTDYDVIFGDIGTSISQSISYQFSNTTLDLPSRSVNFKINKARTEEPIKFAFAEFHGNSEYGQRCNQGGDLRRGVFSSDASQFGICSDQILILNDIDNDSELEVVEILEMIDQNQLSPNSGDTLFIYKKPKARVVNTKYAPVFINNIFVTPSESQNSTSNEDVSRVNKFMLFDNYPNPFNPSTNIQFELQKSGRASLEVFNVLGQKIETLFDKKVSSGSYQVLFDASNLSSGVYFYTLKLDGISKTKKMLLIK
ncbi:MAG: T9SS type A sorting domain-containing protein [Balneola sp.]